MPALFDRLLRAGEGKILKQLDRVAAHINTLEDDFVAMSDEELRAMTGEFKERYAAGESLDDLLPEAFATVREAARRTLGQRHHDVQLMGGAALHMGNIAEMKTGEGKTLVSTLPAYLNAIAGRGVHVVTTNDYLAERDSAWMGRVHRFLGLEVGCILAQMTPAQRRTQYAADITYGTNNEFGFDYLRDNMAAAKSDLVHRDFYFAVVDEVDSILIDEARTPLIISGPADQPTRRYVDFAAMSLRLRRDVHYEVDEKKRTVAITEAGIEKVEDELGIDNLYESQNTSLIGYLQNSLKAKELFRLDKDYVVMDGEILIIDEHTGRILAGRRYSEGMHQAIEAKEKVEIKQENQTLATITLQNFFRLYEKLSGMTGTALTEANEFNKIYALGVVPIRTNRDMIRMDEGDLIYSTEAAKYNAVVDDLVERHKKGQPVLVGTVSVEKSEHLSQLLRRRGVPHEVLNAKYHEREAAIVAQAGRKGAVTVATNMAGRGTDIMLGGNPEFMAAADLRQRGMDPIEDAPEYEAAWPSTLEKFQSQVKTEHDEVRDLGGLYVLGTERHESRRIDNQLRGRSGRQGDPGESRFYLSLEDDLMRLFKSDAVAWVMSAFKLPEDVPIENKRISNAIKSAQTQVEAQNFEIRKNVLKYDDVMNRQREVIYGERRRVLEGADLHEQVRHMVRDTVTDITKAATAEGFPEEWDLDEMWHQLIGVYPVGVSVDEVEESSGNGRNGLTTDFLVTTLVEDADAAYNEREAELTPDVMRDLERRVVLAVLDRKWREHLYEMDYLREGIGLRAMAQRDPLVEYQREGYDMFAGMMDGIKEESVRLLFNLEVSVRPTPESQVVVAQGLVSAKSPTQLDYSSPTETGEVTHRQVELDSDDSPNPSASNGDSAGAGAKSVTESVTVGAGGPAAAAARPVPPSAKKRPQNNRARKRRR